MSRKGRKPNPFGTEIRSHSGAPHDWLGVELAAEHHGKSRSEYLIDLAKADAEKHGLEWPDPGTEAG